VEACCEAALRDGTAREPASVEDALAVDHIARESARTLLAEGQGFGMLTVR
jgi:1-deoxy-D-xylulose-5-phosphate reductoisomerase